MPTTGKRSAYPGKVTWPSGKPKSLSAIERNRRKEAATELPPGGVNTWRPWTLKEAQRQGQAEAIPADEMGPPQPKKRRRRMGVWSGGGL